MLKLCHKQGLEQIRGRGQLLIAEQGRVVMENMCIEGYSKKLLRCKIINKQAKHSERFIELEHFKLWSYMMFHKHGLRIQDVSLWLWINEEDFQAKEEIYSRAVEVVAVNKLCVFIFDEANGFSHVNNRYALKTESTKFKEILASHLSPDLVQSENYEITIHEGYCLKNNLKNTHKLMLGLSDQDERIWYRER